MQSLPRVPPAVPRRGTFLGRWLGRLLLRLLGWRVTGAPLPDVPKAVVIGAPHTSNWDFVGTMGARFALGVDVRWMGKHTLFRPPFGWFMRLLGGLPVNRNAASAAARGTIDAFRRRDRLWLAIAPEGTRSGQAKWKGGFYRIAKSADVPILMIALDARERRIEVGPLLYPGDDEAADWAALEAFYQPRLARHGRALHR